MRALVTAEFTPEGLARLEGLGYAVTTAGWGWTGEPLDGDGLAAAVDGSQLLVCEVEAVDAAVLASSGLRVVATARGTPSNIDLDAATASGVPVLHAPGRNAGSVADFVVGLLLVQARGIARGQTHLRQRGWHVDGQVPYLHFRGRELADLVVGLVGYGAVGRAVARRLRGGFGTRVLACDPPRPPEPGGDAEAADLDALLAASDVVSLHVPDTPATRGLIGAEAFARMRSGALLINTARGRVVDEAALVDALRGGVIAGAALDVFATEPLPRDHPLLGLDNVTLTPHLAGAADDVVAHHTRMICDDLERLAAGARPAHLANPAVWPPRS